MSNNRVKSDRLISCKSFSNTSWWWKRPPWTTNTASWMTVNIGKYCRNEWCGITQEEELMIIYCYIHSYKNESENDPKLQASGVLEMKAVLEIVAGLTWKTSMNMPKVMSSYFSRHSAWNPYTLQMAKSSWLPRFIST